MLSEPAIAILEFIIIIFLVLRAVKYKKKIAELRLENLQQESYYQTAFKQNEVLQSYMDDEHMVWNIEVTPRAIEDGHLNQKMIVLLNGQELTEIWMGRYEKGVEDAKNLDVLVAKPEAKVIRLNLPMDDRSYDGDFRDLVNDLTAIAERFKDSQQLRGRLSSHVTNFREYMKKRQKGERPKFPKADT
jgi:hypothetical protein